MNHHAIVCVGNSIAQSAVPQTFHTQSVDISHIVCDRFGIDDARNLSVAVLQRPVESDQRVFVIATKALPVEAQNALLKLFEEPPTHVQFYLVIPQEGLLIETLRSRVAIADVLENTNEINSDFFDEFLSSSYAERLITVADITKKKDVDLIEALVSGVEKYAHTKLPESMDLVNSVLFVRQYIKTPGASAKMLLEELVLALPKG